MLPEMAVLKIPYESSLAPKTASSVSIPWLEKNISRFVMELLIFYTKKYEWDDKLDG